MIDKPINVIYSKSNDIYFNLAFENYLLKNFVDDYEVLFLFINSPCVVIGRAQNPFVECNLNKIYEDKIEFIRRQSGGGAVYNDLGNLNFSFISPRKKFDKAKNLETIINFLSDIDITAYKSERNDLFVIHNNENRKITGCAFRETRKNCFHHGTLLIDANINKLTEYLHHSQDKNIDSKGVKSVKSKVVNISEINNKVSIKDLNYLIFNIQKSYSKIFKRECFFKVIYESNFLYSLLDEEITVLKSWNWKYAKTLPFIHTFKYNNEDFIVDIKQGKVNNIFTYDGKFLSDNLFNFLQSNEIFYKSEDLKKLEKKLEFMEYQNIFIKIREYLEKIESR